MDQFTAEIVEVKNRPGQRLRVEMYGHWKGALQASPLRLLATLGVGLAAAAVILAMPMLQWEHGYFMGLLTASLIAVIAWTTYLNAGHHNLHFGLMGEECTGETVLTLRRRFQGWHLVSNLYFEGHGDVDHVLIGPGGVFAIESKWTNVPWAVTREGINGPDRSPTKQARFGARKIASELRTVPKPLNVTVTPIVVLWGPGAPEINEGIMMVDDVLVAEGRRGRVWVRELRGDRLGRDTIRAATRKLEAALRARDDDRIAMKFAPPVARSAARS